jgi:hypothetical protein
MQELDNNLKDLNLEPLSSSSSCSFAILFAS